MRRLCMAVMVSILATSAGVAAQGWDVAHAATVTTLTCAENEAVTFSPPLTLNNALSTGTFAIGYTCVPASVSTAPSVSAGPPFTQPLLPPSTRTAIGTCVLATYSEGSALSYIIGGTLQVQVGTDVERVMVLSPTSGSSACNLASATGQGALVYENVS